MSNDAEFEQEQTEGRNPLRDRNKVLEAENQQYREQIVAGEAAIRELAFMKVGIDTDSPTGKLFAKAYDGEATVEAIAQAAAEYGLVKPPSPVNADENEQQAWSRAASSHTSGSVGPDDVDMVEKIRNATSPQELEQLLRQVRTVQQG